MSDDGREALGQAFESTGYVVLAHPLVGGVRHVLRVGAEHPLLDTALTLRGYIAWGFLTAWNPGAKAQALRRNESLHRELGALLDALGHPRLPAVGLAEDQRWFEESLFVPGLSRDDARELGRRFGQQAVLWGHVGGAAELLWCLEPGIP
jgi:hypothetical protein